MNNAFSLPSCIQAFLLPFLAGALIGCDASSSKIPLKPNVLKDEASWTYYVRFNRQPLDSSAVDTIVTTTIRMEVTKTDVELGNRSGLVELESFAPSDPGLSEHNWYQQSPDSLVEVAATFKEVGIPLSRKRANLKALHFRSGPIGLPVLVRRRLGQLSHPHAKDAKKDTLIHEDSRIVLQAPLIKGIAWTSFRKPLVYSRTVTGHSVTETPAGRFKTTRVKSTFSDFTLSFHWVDYYASEGLVRRVIADTMRRRNAEGEDIGKFVFREVYTLTDHKN